MPERKMRPKRSKQGEIVEVEGGRIIRALARKDRHSKVCTAKGPKDRRVRLSADTAIRFYDVQDRLGYDRPSLAIDWLMNEARPAIEKLNGDHSLLPAMSSSPSNIAVSHSQYFHQASQELDGFYNLNHNYETTENGIQNQQQNVSEFQNSIFSSFFNNYPDSSSSRNTSLFSANSTHLDFEGTGEMVQFQRMVTWNSNPSSSNGKESAAQGFDVDSSLPWRLGHFSDQNHALFTQREPLQSSYLPSFQTPVPFPAPNTSLGIGFANDGFLGFSFPAFIQDQEEEPENLISKQLSSATSLLHYQD